MQNVINQSILIVDDEPEYLHWIEEYAKSKNLECEYAENLSEALDVLKNKERFALVLVDMNIPVFDNLKGLLEEPIMSKYPGILVATKFRNAGYGSYQIIGYTVHDDDAIDAELDKLKCRYVLKGRPHILKSVMQSSLDIIQQQTQSAH